MALAISRCANACPTNGARCCAVAVETVRLLDRVAVAPNDGLEFGLDLACLRTTPLCCVHEEPEAHVLCSVCVEHAIDLIERCHRIDVRHRSDGRVGPVDAYLTRDLAEWSMALASLLHCCSGHVWLSPVLYVVVLEYGGRHRTRLQICSRDLVRIATSVVDHTPARCRHEHVQYS